MHSMQCVHKHKTIPQRCRTNMIKRIEVHLTGRWFLVDFQLNFHTLIIHFIKESSLLEDTITKQNFSKIKWDGRHLKDCYFYGTVPSRYHQSHYNHPLPVLKCPTSSALQPDVRCQLEKCHIPICILPCPPDCRCPPDTVCP